MTDKTVPHWIGESDSPWGIPVVDLRPVTLSLISSSKDIQAARNAISFAGEDGTAFANEQPESDEKHALSISFFSDQTLVPGVLFAPREMEQKWAIFYHDESIIFVRSWLRKVFARVLVEQTDSHVHFREMVGALLPGASPAFNKAAVRFLIVSHALNQPHPAPLRDNFRDDLVKAAHSAFSEFGNLALCGTFDLNFQGECKRPLRTSSLLHIAASRGDTGEVDRLLRTGIWIDVKAGDGSTPLAWSMFGDAKGTFHHLLEKGADPDARFDGEGTVIMASAEINKPDFTEILVSAGAKVDAVDARGYSALHRAAALGHLEVARLLLEHGADSSLEANGETPLSLARLRDQHNIVELLEP